MRISQANYVNPILERAERFMQVHPENFEHNKFKQKEFIGRGNWGKWSKEFVNKRKGVKSVS